ncbi:hypothetical protein GLYMA_11G074050v4 [Glycine max]|nr:hypothetical protein GLYMA_11G074050v4 [Glycine max]KAH1158023.1 hypothetical protein GYH30_030320 [Glycine max]
MGIELLFLLLVVVGVMEKNEASGSFSILVKCSFMEFFWNSVVLVLVEDVFWIIE